MRRMLDPKTIGGGGGLPSTIEFDKEGNRKVKNNLGVDGKLTLKSLVSASNPDGDITKELGGGGGSIRLYNHHIYLYYKDVDDYGYVYFDYYSTNAEQFTADTLIISMKGKSVICSGYLFISTNRIASSITSIDNNKLQVKLYSIEDSRPGISNFNISKDNITIQDQVYPIN